MFAEAFNPDKHLALPVQAVKIDIEGYEADLLNWNKPLPPTVMEVHNWWLYERFVKRGWKLIYMLDSMLGMCLMKNF